MRAISMTPRDASVGTPRLGLTGGLSSAAMAALTPRFFAARETQVGLSNVHTICYDHTTRHPFVMCIRGSKLGDGPDWQPFHRLRRVLPSSHVVIMIALQAATVMLFRAHLHRWPLNFSSCLVQCRRPYACPDSSATIYCDHCCLSRSITLHRQSHDKKA